MGRSSHAVLPRPQFCSHGRSAHQAPPGGRASFGRTSPEYFRHVLPHALGGGKCRVRLVTVLDSRLAKQVGLVELLEAGVFEEFEGGLEHNARLKPWPKPWLNMRATELADQFPSHVCASWLGHTEAVADAHYRMTTDTHFSKALNSGMAAVHQHGSSQATGPIARSEKRSTPPLQDDAHADTNRISDAPEGMEMTLTNTEWERRDSNKHSFHAIKHT